MKEPEETFKSSFSFVVTDIKKFDSEKPYISAPIKHYGYSWQAKVYVEESGDFIGVILENLSDIIVEAKFTITLINQNRNGEDVIYEENELCKFSPIDTADSSWGCEDFCGSELIHETSSGFNIDNEMKFKIDIILYSQVTLMNQDLAMALENSSESDLIDIANNDIGKVIVPLSGVRAGHVEHLQDKLVNGLLK